MTPCSRRGGRASVGQERGGLFGAEAADFGRFLRTSLSGDNLNAAGVEAKRLGEDEACGGVGPAVLGRGGDADLETIPQPAGERVVAGAGDDLESDAKTGGGGLEAHEDGKCCKLRTRFRRAWELPGGAGRRGLLPDVYKLLNNNELRIFSHFSDFLLDRRLFCTFGWAILFGCAQAEVSFNLQESKMSKADRSRFGPVSLIRGSTCPR